MEMLERPQSSVAEYQPFYAQLAQLEADNSSLAFDYESKRGNKDARSHVNSLRLTKGALERTRKTAKEESLRIGKSVDAEAKEISVRIEAMISVHQVKLDEFEQRETDRVADLQRRLDALSTIRTGCTVNDYKAYIATLQAVVIDASWAEFIEDAARTLAASLSQYSLLLAAQEWADSEAAELARLRLESAARAKQDHDERIAREATERAAAVAEQAALQARAIAEQREIELKIAAETAERLRVDAEQKAIENAKIAQERAEAAQVKAIQDEQSRVAAIAKAEADATAKREANKAHKTAVNRAAVAALVKAGVAEQIAQLCITMIAKGEVPAIHINY